MPPLMDTYRPIIYAFAMSRLRNAEDAQDVVQDTFLKAWRQRGQLRDEKRLQSWLMTIAYRVIATKIRTRKVMAPLPPAVADDTYRFEAARREDAAYVRAAVEGLCSTDRALLVAFYFEGLTIKEIAARENVPVGTVKSRMFIARQRLREALCGS